MNYHDERYTLASRAGHIYRAKRTALRTQFGLEDDPHPRSGTEMIQRIKDGMYVIKPSMYEENGDEIHWRDPSVVEDPEGYRKALITLDDEYSALNAAIYALEPKDSLARLEAW